MTAVLAIFKAGGAYLPFEPHFPAERIARMLSRAGCRLVLTERGSSAVLDRAVHSLSGVETLLIDAALAEGHSETDPDVNVWPQQLSYIFFTSGSTGEPKGAMCEHDGMLNHLLAKIDDLRIGEGDVLAQTAPQCFDISLWQLLAALLVGGRTLLVEQEIILDAKRFIDKIVKGRVSVLQVVPSYLEVLVSYLEQHPRELPHLRRVSVTGEVLKKELVQRWFAVKPAIKLMNAYGLTETSDDTNHEILDSVPRRERVPLGRPINNVRVYIVDEQLSPVPLGAPGEIVFAGICVGRGYIGDSERTQRAFLTDPHHPYERLYRSGDYGRWLPEGKVEFLGRRDTQVKISGFRIEIGEIENALLRVPGVREDAVVVTERPDRSKHLVAFYTGERQLDTNALRDRLAASLPKYMVPTGFHWRNRLPLTDNGQVDKRELAGLAAEREDAGQSEHRLGTATEDRLAAAEGSEGRRFRCRTHWRPHCPTWTGTRANRRCCEPGRPGMRRAGRPSTATRCAPWSPNTGRCWFAVSGCATRPRPKRSFGGLAVCWPRGRPSRLGAATLRACTPRRSGRPTSTCACTTNSATRSSSPASCCLRASLRRRSGARPRWPIRRLY